MAMLASKPQAGPPHFHFPHPLLFHPIPSRSPPGLTTPSIPPPLSPRPHMAGACNNVACISTSRTSSRCPVRSSTAAAPPPSRCPDPPAATDPTLPSRCPRSSEAAAQLPSPPPSPTWSKMYRGGRAKLTRRHICRSVSRKTLRLTEPVHRVSQLEKTSAVRF
jgi:hypothetical protein